MGSARSASETTRASAPSTCARSPRTPATSWAPRLVSGSAARRDGLADAVEQQVAGRGEVAADDQHLGVEHVQQRRHDLAERAAGVADHAPAAGVAGLGGLDHRRRP